jgi:hypothetical protein
MKKILLLTGYDPGGSTLAGMIADLFGKSNAVVLNYSTYAKDEELLEDARRFTMRLSRKLVVLKEVPPYYQDEAAEVAKKIRAMHKDEISVVLCCFEVQPKRFPSQDFNIFHLTSNS